MIVESFDSGSPFHRLFNALYFAAKKITAGGGAKMNPEDFSGLEAYAEELDGALDIIRAGGVKDTDGIPVPDDMLMGMFRALWCLEKQFINCFDYDGTARSAEYWDLLIGAIDAFAKKFPFRFAEECAIAFINEVDRRGKKEAEAAAKTA